MTERICFDAEGVRRAAARLRAGELVAFPTETVYGLGARADDAAAVRRIFVAKGRPATNPLIVHVLDVAAARALADGWPASADRLADAFWPGPLTLVVRRRPGAVPDEVTAGGDTVALRVPSHPAARALLEATQLSIVAPSANRSGSISPTTAEHVLQSLDGRIDAVLDGGPTGDATPGSTLYGIESTIVDVTREPAVLLRHGALPPALLSRHVELVGGADSPLEPGGRALAPGSHGSHYAPRARLVVVEREHVFDEVITRRARGQRVGVLEREPGSGFEALCERLPDEPAGYGALLYAALHRLDDAGCDAIIAASPPDGEAWDAVRDRLRRASGSASGR